MSIMDSYRHNFKMLLRAAENQDLCIVDCKDRATGKQVIVICAHHVEEDGTTVLTPLAKMFDGNPYEELDAPFNISAEEKH